MRSRRSVRRDGPATVVLFGLFGVGNHGNEASLEAALVQLRRVAPAARPIVACPAPAAVTDQHGADAVPINSTGGILSAGPRPVRLAMRPLAELRRWIATIRFLRRVDLVIVPGTGVLDDFGVTPWTFPYQLFRWTLAARAARCPFTFLSVGAGPIEHATSQRLMRSAARLATSCSFRDRTSRDYMGSIGRDVSADRVTADLVFSLPLVPGTAPAPERSTATIGLGVMAYYGWRNERDEGELVFRRYLSKLVSFAGELLDRGHDLRLLIGEVTDVAAATEVRRLVVERVGTAAGSRVRFDAVTDLAGLVGEIDVTDCVVTSRYHNVVAALMAGRPAVSVGYAEKNRDLLQRVGFGDFCQDIEDFDVDRLLADTLSVLERRDELNAAMTAHVAALRRTVVDQFDDLPWRRPR